MRMIDDHVSCTTCDAFTNVSREPLGPILVCSINFFFEFLN